MCAMAEGIGRLVVHQEEFSNALGFFFFPLIAGIYSRDCDRLHRGRQKRSVTYHTHINQSPWQLFHGVQGGRHSKKRI
jgi:hypothetical protein